MKILEYTSKRGKFENNWRSKSLENLEKDNWGKIPKEESYLVTTCHKLRKKTLNQYDVEDLRILIGQDLGLKYLIPLAIEILSANILAEGHYYEGDLLNSVLTSNPDYWKIEREDWNKIIVLYTENIELIKKEASKYCTGREIIKSYSTFSSIK